MVLPPDVAMTDGLRLAVRNAGECLARTADRAIRSARWAGEAALERQQLLGMFGGRSVYAERADNEYDADSPRPWLVVTTARGRVRVGWRKRVISIDWSDSDEARTAEELFPNEDVSRCGRCIHAWGYEKGREYIDAILGGLPEPGPAARVESLGGKRCRVVFRWGRVACGVLTVRQDLWLDTAEDSVWFGPQDIESITELPDDQGV